MNHQIVDQRSLELHRLVADKVRLRPDLMNIALENIKNYFDKPTASFSGKQAYLEWAKIIRRKPFDEVLQILTEDSEEGQRLRQSSPFSGVLTDDERMSIFRKYESLRV